MTATPEQEPAVSQTAEGDYFLLIETETYGPYTLEQVHDLWLEKEVPLDTLYIRKGMPQVRPLTEVINQVIACRKPEPEPEPVPVAAPPPRSNSKVMVLGILLFAGFYATLYGINTIFFPAAKAGRVVHAEVVVSPVQIRITNNDDVPWTDKIVRLNDDLAGACQYRIVRLEPGKTVTVPLVAFADNQQKHFQPWSQVVLGVWIGGNGFDFRWMGIKRL